MPVRALSGPGGFACLDKEQAERFKDEAREWYDTTVAQAPSMQPFIGTECWTKVEEGLQEILDTIEAHVGQCWPTRAAMVADIRRYYGLSIKDLKEWARTHCKIKPPEPTVGCLPGEKLRTCTLVSRYYARWENDWEYFAKCTDGFQGWIKQANFPSKLKLGMTIKTCGRTDPSEFHPPAE